MDLTLAQKALSQGPGSSQGPGQWSAASPKAVGTVFYRGRLRALLSYSSRACHFAGFAGLESMSTIETLFLHRTHIFERGNKKFLQQFLFTCRDLYPHRDVRSHPSCFQLKLLRDQVVFVCSYRREYSS